MTSTHAAAKHFDVSEDTITTLVGQIADDPDLWNPETEQITDAGLDILRDQLSTSDPIGDDLLANVERTARLSAVADQVAGELRHSRDAAIRAAADYGHQRTKIAKRAGFSRERLYQILGSA